MLDRKELDANLRIAAVEGAKVLEHSKRGAISVGLVLAHFLELGAKKAAVACDKASNALKEQACNAGSSTKPKLPRTQE